MWVIISAPPPQRKGPRAGRAPGCTSALSAPLVSIHVWKAAPRSSCCCAERRQAVPPGPHQAGAPGSEPGPSHPTFPSGILAHSMPSGELCSPSPCKQMLPLVSSRHFHSALSPPRLSPNSSKWPACCVLCSCLSSGSHGCCVHQTHYCTSQLLSTRLYSATGPLHRLLTLPAPFLHHSICCSGGSQPGVMLPPRGHLAISLDFRGCHKWRRRFYWDAVGGSQTAAKHPPMHRTIAHSKESSGSKCPQRCG